MLSTPFSAIAYLESLLQTAMAKRFSDLHIEPQGSAWLIRVRQDGLLRLYDQLPNDAGLNLVNRIKILAQCDITEKRLPQDGGFSQYQHDFRVSTCPTAHGEKVVIRAFNLHHQAFTLNQLGFSEAQLQVLHHYLAKPHGLILVTGPTGSGKTITLYSALQYLHKTQINIATVEDPIERYLPGINQIPIHPKAGLHFATALRALLRQDPDIVMVGEMRDVETIDMALHAAQTGHLVLSTLHTNTSYEAIIRLLQMGIAPYQISSSVRLIIAQRLIRTLCPQCRHQSPPGCPACQQGYLGRTGVYELLEMTDALSHLIHAKADRQALKHYQQQQGLMNLWQHGLSKVQAGLTRESELRRVLDPS